MTSNPNSEENMSVATKKLISRAKLLVPPMLEKFHKGEFVQRPSHAYLKHGVEANGALTLYLKVNSVG
jgi:hypothetical protein